MYGLYKLFQELYNSQPIFLVSTNRKRGKKDEIDK